MRQIDDTISVQFLDRCEEAPKFKDQPIDLLFLDINMPHHDGFFWLKGIRKHGYENLPIVMYTNSVRPENIIQAYREGANLYYIKPTSFSDLLKGLKALIDLDWTDPFSVKEAYWHDGKYATFEVA